jgi:hypothetical protein
MKTAFFISLSDIRRSFQAGIRQLWGTPQPSPIPPADLRHPGVSGEKNERNRENTEKKEKEAKKQKNPETPKLQGTRRREKEKENHTPPTLGEKERENKQKKKTINRKKRTKIGKEIKRES